MNPQEKFKKIYDPYEGNIVNSVGEINYKKILGTLLVSLILISKISFGQNLNLADLEKIMRNRNWSYSDNFLSEKNWVYLSNNNTSVGKKITWAYDYNSYNEAAAGFLYLELDGDKPSKLTYLMFNLKSSNLVNKRISSSGYIFKDNKMADNMLIKVYSKGNFLLFTGKEYDSEDGITLYEYNLIKKGGHHDSQNGKKGEYSDKGWLEYTLKDGVHQGPVLLYHTKGGNVKMKSSFQNGKLNGNTVEYFENGKVFKKYYMKNGNKSGLEIEYHPNGIIARKVNYKNGIQNGKTTEFDENGQIEEIYFQKDGEIELVKAFKKGKLFVEMTLSNNERNGLSIRYDSMERVESKGNYFNGLKTGVWEEYYYSIGNGNIGKLITEYKAGKKWGKYQKILINDKNEQVIYQMYYENDTLSGLSLALFGDTIVAANFSKGKLNGPKKYYLCPDIHKKTDVNKVDLEKLILLFEGRYLFGGKTGTWIFFSRDNTDNLPYLTQTYIANKLNGLFERRDDLGNSIEKGSYLNDLKHGEWSYITYKNNSKDELKKVTYEKGNVKGFTELYKGEKLIYSGFLDERESDSEVFIDGSWVENITDLPFDNRDNIYQKCNYDKGKLNGESIYECGNEILNEETYFLGDIEGKCTYYDSGIRVIEKKYSTSKEKLDFKSINSNLFSINLFDSLGKNIITNFNYMHNNQYTKTNFKDGYYIKQNYKKTYQFEKVWEVIAKSKDPNIGLELKKLITSNAQVKQGDFMKIATYNSKQMPENDTLIIGNYNQNKKDGVWTFFHKEQKLKIVEYYSNGETINPELYLNIDGTKYSGKYTKIDLVKKRKEVISIKKGQRNGKTMFYSLIDNEIIDKIKYKNGIKK